MLTLTRSFLTVAAAAGVAACAQIADLNPPEEASLSPTAQESHAYCQQGATCILKPMAMLVLNKDNPGVNFDFRSWILYDPRPWPIGQRYVALMNASNDPVCEGYYASVGINIRAPTALTCFPREAKGRGSLRFDSTQDAGPFAGRSVGTGVFETGQETILIVHGATPQENRTASFLDLWTKYGGEWQRPLAPGEASAKRISDLPRLARTTRSGAGPASASMGSR